MGCLFNCEGRYSFQLVFATNYPCLRTKVKDKKKYRQKVVYFMATLAAAALFLLKTRHTSGGGSQQRSLVGHSVLAPDIFQTYQYVFHK
jgi:hypothetical protein